MGLNIYFVETSEIKLEILREIKKDLYNIMFYKIRSNSKAYLELNTLIDKLSIKEEVCKQSIKDNLLSSENKISQVKLDTTILKNILELKYDLKYKSIAETMMFLIDEYKQDKIIGNLSKIEKYEISKTFENNLIESKFNVCSCSNLSNKVVYTTDDLIVYNNIEYLDLKKFKAYHQYDSEDYYFAPNFTLADLDDFFKLLLK